MSFTSKAEICKTFNIDSSLDPAQIIKELTMLQAEIHPDRKLDYTDTDQERFTLLEEAKSFLRETPEQTLVPVSQIVEIIKLVKSEGITQKKESEVIAEKISQTSETILRTIKHHYLPRKITVASISSIITLLWAFPSVVSEHPVLGQLIDVNSSLFTLLWLDALMLLSMIWFITYRAEQYTKNVLHTLENVDKQWSIFSAFISNSGESPVEFSSKDLEDYILKHISKPYKSYQSRILHRQYSLAQVSEIIPHVSDMIIARALEKGIITKLPDAGWYDKYKVN